MRWEYRVVTVEKFLADMRYIGSDRWELVTISNDLVYFKRPLGVGLPDSRKVASILIADLSKRNDITSKGAADFIRNTVAIANTIENIGWRFEPGDDLIKNILYPKFIDPEIK